VVPSSERLSDAAIRILDLTRLLPGSFASWLLAGMGAEVIKIEQPGRGDYLRHGWPRRGGVSNTFHIYNRGKESVGLDLKTEFGKRALLDLVTSADVVLDGNRPGVLDRLGVGWSACRERNPAIVFCAITGFGQTGPYAQRAGHDVNYLSLAGVMVGLKDVDSRPVAPWITVADMVSGPVAAVGILGAVSAARETGEGRFVDVSMLDSVLAFQGSLLATELMPGDLPGSDGAPPENNSWEFGIYRTADGAWISLDPYEAKFKDKLWAIIEREEAGKRPAAGDGEDAVRGALAQAIAGRSRDRWDELLGQAEVCYAPVYELAELANDPNVRERGLLGDAMDPDVASPSIAHPLRIDPPLPFRSGDAPVLGADTARLLSEVGWDAEAIQHAQAIGAIVCAEPVP
jgi:crotonobetainyl-CoA:carnitine CoA-transferase CaiB-like acyl-CoA transferase